MRSIGRAFAVVVFLAAVCRGADAAPSLSQAAVFAVTSASQTTSAATITSSGAGHLIVVGLIAFDPAPAARTVSGVTDNIGNTYTQATGAASSSVSGSTTTDVWYCLSASAGVTTVTGTWSGAAWAGSKAVIVWEVQGMTTAAFDLAAHVSNGTGAANLDAGASVTTTGASGFVVGVANTDNSIDLNPNTGNEFTSGGASDPSGTGWAGASLISSTAAAHQPVWHDTNPTSPYGASTAAFKDTGGGGGGGCANPSGLTLFGVSKCD